MPIWTLLLSENNNINDFLIKHPLKLSVNAKCGTVRQMNADSLFGNLTAKNVKIVVNN